MKIDGLGCLITEGPAPGCYGDSMAETSRLAHLNSILSLDIVGCVDRFRIEKGYCRHPTIASIWPCSSDQLIPWYLYLKTKPGFWDNFIVELKQRIKSAGYKTPDGNVAAPILLALLFAPWLLNSLIAAQAMLFKVPWRWDDGKKKLVSTSTMSCDFLNWFHCAIYCKPWILKMVPKETLKAKIRSYYKPEKNVQWLLDLYDRAIEKAYG